MAKFKRSPGCGSRGDCCGPGGGPCLKFVPYIAPFIENGDLSGRFSNWNLSGLNQFNTFENFGFSGWLFVVAQLSAINGLVDNLFTVKLYKSATVSPANLVASWSTTVPAPGIIVGQTINFTEENASGISGSVDYDVPLNSYSTYTMSVRGTNTECDLTVGGIAVNTVTWQVTAIDDPFTVFNPGTGGSVTISNTSDVIRSIAVALNSDLTRCLAEGFYGTPLPGGPFLLHANYAGFPSLEEDIGYSLHFNDFTGTARGTFALVVNLATSGGGRNDVVAFQVSGDPYDICLEIPPTIITNSNGDEITIRMDHS